ncbi:MAG: hypothetical protein ACI9TH_002163 [Kiritimatiellia bacterium]|jgi:hypothetical protein
MAWRLSNSICRIELDNRQPGKLEGEIWLLGREQPVRLLLVGNALRDIAGAHLTVTNPHPTPGDDTRLEAVQNGVAGDLTASRKVRVIDGSIKESFELREGGGNGPAQMGNSVYLEWFSSENGRVVIEATHFTTSISAYDWQMSQAEEDEQRQRNLESINEWVSDLSQTMRAVGIDDEAYERAMSEGDGLFEEDCGDREGEFFEDDRSMNEFEWERHLKESDKLTDKFGRLMDVYMDHPDRDQIVAREMGWSWLEDALEEVAEDSFDEFDSSFDDIPPLVPKLETEGVDWIKKENGDITHPLTDRAFRAAMDMWHYCNENELLGDDSDEDVHLMVFQAQTLSAKLAGALNGLAYDTYVEGGFIVACLKRALAYFNESASAMSKVEQKKLIDAQRLQDFRCNLYDIRQEMLHLMARFRQEHSE